MAKPNPKGPSTTVKVYCSKCRGQLFRYRKGGTGSLVKCFKERIVEDYTSGDGACPHCSQVFGREALIRGAPAFKIIGGKVFFKK
ncbi:hypothetical protein [Pseudobacteriovorax antillogorgiicola]|uniref:hypothetical protein n=1 Tax=Pseudobacteriovorax antillogorgiicola TaxID=1513793 RepID=UPI001044707D|nr:hypothetical protein [Pseudobacteriovorax antillogorgiicola]